MFSNAAIQWVPDHPHLIPRLVSMVRPGGQIVMQIPPALADKLAHAKAKFTR